MKASSNTASGRPPRARSKPAALVAYELANPAKVHFNSRGVVLIVGDAPRVLACADRLKAELKPIAVVSGHRQPESALDGVTVVNGQIVELTGHLGQFSAKAAGPQAPLELAPLSLNQDGYFDLVLDLSPTPLLNAEVPPLGYYAPGDDDIAVARILDDLPSWVGEFSKPKYVEYKPELCSHGSKHISGCRRCLNVCPAQAITSLGATVQVDTNRCQGCGSCTIVCPSSALRYDYPNAATLHQHLHRRLAAFRAAGGESPCVLFHNADTDDSEFTSCLAEMPDWVIPVALHALASVGIDTWLTVLAAGAAQVVLLERGDSPATAIAALAQQVDIARQILVATGDDPERLKRLMTNDVKALDHLFAQRLQGCIPSAEPDGSNTKRVTTFRAIDHLCLLTTPAPSAVELAPAALFGAVEVDQEACTLCLACVTLCPTNALQTDQNQHELKFVESACVQCGLCRNGCPENAIRLLPRLVFDADIRNQARLLNQAEMAHCVECNDPFMPLPLLRASLDRVKDNAMIKAEGLRHLQLCPPCRASAMLQAQVLNSRRPSVNESS